MDAPPPPPPPPPAPRSFAHRIVHTHLVDVLLLTDLLFDAWLRDDDATSIAFACMDRSAVQLVYSRLRVHTALMLEQVLVQWPRAVAAMGDGGGGGGGVSNTVLRIARDTLAWLHDGEEDRGDDDDDDDDDDGGGGNHDRPSKRARIDDASRDHRTHPTDTVLKFHRRCQYEQSDFKRNDARERHLELLSCTRVWHPSPGPPPSDTLHQAPPPTPTVASLDAFLAAPLPLFRTVYCADPRVYSYTPPVLLARIADARFAAALARPRGRPSYMYMSSRMSMEELGIYRNEFDRRRSGSSNGMQFELDADDLVDYRLLRMLAPLTAIAHPRDLPAGTTFVYVHPEFAVDQLRPGEIPTTVRHLVFASESSYNRPFEPGALPASLVRLVFLARASYNHPFAAGVLPPTLQRLSFNGAYRLPFAADALPESLRELEFRWSSRWKMTNDSLQVPPSIERVGLHRFDMFASMDSLRLLGVPIASVSDVHALEPDRSAGEWTCRMNSAPSVSTGQSGSSTRAAWSTAVWNHITRDSPFDLTDAMRDGILAYLMSDAFLNVVVREIDRNRRMRVWRPLLAAQSQPITPDQPDAREAAYSSFAESTLLRLILEGAAGALESFAALFGPMISFTERTIEQVVEGRDIANPNNVIDVGATGRLGGVLLYADDNPEGQLPDGGNLADLLRYVTLVIDFKARQALEDPTEQVHAMMQAGAEARTVRAANAVRGVGPRGPDGAAPNGAAAVVALVTNGILVRALRMSDDIEYTEMLRWLDGDAHTFNRQGDAWWTSANGQIVALILAEVLRSAIVQFLDVHPQP